MIQVVIVASSLALRAGLRHLLGDDDRIAVAEEASHLSDLEGNPAEADVLLLVSSDTGVATSLSEFPAGWSESSSAMALLLLSDYPQAAREILNAPWRAWGILPLETSGEELAAALHALHQGLVAGAPHLMEPVYRDLLRAKNDSEIIGRDYPQPEDLTAREGEVLQLLAHGLANKQIAAALEISEHTVKFHVSSIYSKLGVGNRTEAVRLGVRRGLILL